MTPPLRTATLALLVSTTAGGALAQDWPQWRGAQRDAKASGFAAPKTWPQSLTKKWQVTVGDGVASPALVGDKVYVFSRQDGTEVLRCLQVTDGRELWKESYESLGATGPAQSFSGPRSSPAVAEGKVVTLGVRGMLSVVDAATGAKVWRKDDFRAWPNFYPSSSPLVLNGLAIAQLGGRDNGAIAAYALGSGEQKWKWSGPAPAYASPVLMTLGKRQLLIAQTETKLVAIDAADGSLAWELAGAPPQGAPPAGPGGAGGPGGPGGPGGEGGGRGGRGGGGGGPRENRAATPAVDGQTVYVAGRGFKAYRLEQVDGKVTAKELWSNPDRSVQFSSPTFKGGLIYGLAGNNELFCLKAEDGSVAWSAAFPTPERPAGAGAGPAPQAHAQPALAPALQGALDRAQAIAHSGGATVVFAQTPPPGTPPPAGGGADDAGRPRRQGVQGGPGGPGGQGGPGGRGGFGGGRGGGGGGGYGNIVDAGPVLMALTPAGQLVAFEPGGKEFKMVARYKVADSQTHACPVISGNRILIKDKESVTLWTIE